VRILVVEDSAKMAGLLKKGLEREGYAVDVASSGEDAIWLAAEHDYDAMVLDVILDSGQSLLDGFAAAPMTT
jgi:two-component system, OmpR family, response regulator